MQRSELAWRLTEDERAALVAARLALASGRRTAYLCYALDSDTLRRYGAEVSDEPLRVLRADIMAALYPHTALSQWLDGRVGSSWGAEVSVCRQPSWDSFSPRRVDRYVAARLLWVSAMLGEITDTPLRLPLPPPHRRILP